MVNILALSVTCGDSSPKVGALGSPRKLHLFTESFPFKEGLSAQGVSGVTGNFAAMPRPLPLGEVDLRSKDGEGEHAKNKSICNGIAVFLKFRRRWLQMLFCFV